LKKKLEEPWLLNYSGFNKKHNKIKRKGLKWAIFVLPPNHKRTYMFKANFDAIMDMVLMCVDLSMQLNNET